MVKKTVKLIFLFLISNPVFTAALIVAVLFYSSILKVKDRHELKCLFESQSIQRMSGQLYSNPSLTSSKKYYSADFNVTKAWTKSNRSAQCKGNVKILIPVSEVEALYPGKLFTSSVSNSDTNKCLWENGCNFELTVSSVNNANLYIVNSYKSNGFAKNLTGRFRLFRGMCRLKFKRLMYEWGDCGGFLLALLSGSKEYTDSSISDAFRLAGLSHILALSGMHLSLFGGLAFFFGNKMIRRSAADFLELCAVFFFVWFAGNSPSLFRALLSSLIVFINSLLRMNRFKGITVLSAAFLLHLMIFPEHIKTSAFMLSYGALTGIMSIGQLLRMLLGKHLFPRLCRNLSDSAGAMIFTSPVTVSIFKAIMPAGIIAGIFVNPLVILFLYAGLTGTILSLLLPFLSTVFNDIMYLIYSIIKAEVVYFSKFPHIQF